MAESEEISCILYSYKLLQAQSTYVQPGSITCTTCQCRCPSKVLKPWESKLPSENGPLSLLWLCSECAKVFRGLWVCAASPQFKYKRSSPWRRTCSWLLYIKTKPKQKKKKQLWIRHTKDKGKHMRNILSDSI